MNLSVASRLADDTFSEHARWIGIIVANGTILESELEGVYGAILGLGYHESKIAYYAIQNWVTRRDTISASITHFYPDTEIEKQWKALLDDLKSAYRMRNAAAHAIWAEDPKTKELQMRHTNVSGIYSHPKSIISVNNLKQNANLIAGTGGKLNQLQALIRSNSIHRKKD
jgi:hypothetical protein